ncbi:unnamed protein product [Symbiodinium sp. CCMP2592]|nr:unnamed protein product [Symbiodinium sp. CCMP2592]
MRRSTRQNLALALIFMLAVRDVSAARHGYNTAQMVSSAAKGMEQNRFFHESLASIDEGGSFSLHTMWAKGKENRLLGGLTWTNATITFSRKGGHGRGERRQTAKYLEVTLMDKTYRIMPDAVVMTKELKTMAVVGISGWQAFEGGSWGPSKYGRDEILWIRTEQNPIIGVTTSSTLPWRYAGYPVYQKGSETPYYFYKGVQSTIDIEEVNLASDQTPSEVRLEVPGQSTEPLKAPDREVMVLLDAMLGQSSCLNSPSLCAYRCYYNPEEDKCGPVAFCTETTDGEMPSVLAPFGDQQKCKAIGGSSHAVADAAIVSEAIPALKSKALDVVEKLEDTEAVSSWKASRSSMQKTAELWEEAVNLLQVFETLPARTDPEAGKFKAAHRRASQTDMKHWRHRKDRLTTEQYNAAAGKSVGELRGSTSFSVAAKLHSELVVFILKRPRIIIETAKLESKEKCLLMAETDAEKSQLTLFVKYFMKVPGYNRGDLDGQVLDMPAHCQDYLNSLGRRSMAELSDALSAADEAKEHMETSGAASSLELRSERLRMAVSRDEGTSSVLQTDSGIDDSELAAPLLLAFWYSILGLMALMLAITVRVHTGDDDDAGFNAFSCTMAYVLGGCTVFSSVAMNTDSVGYSMAFTALLYVTMPYLFRKNQHRQGPVTTTATTAARGNSALLQKPESKVSKLHFAAAQLYLAS